MENKGFRRVLTDWTFIGTVVAALALILSAEFGRTTPSVWVVSVLIAVWMIMLVLQYVRILELLEETRASRTELTAAIHKLSISQLDADVSKGLSLISLEAFVERESSLQPGDSVLVFANTLEIDYEPMFDVVVANLKKNVTYRYILFETDQADDWEKFLRLLRNNGVTQLPLVVFEKSQIATLIKSSSVIYDFQAHGKQPQGYSVLTTSHSLDTCVVMSPEIAAQTRDAFYRIWRSLHEDPHRNRTHG